ncbi:MAG: hypothetical protein E6J94_10295 [Methanobacteriota archaeon]|nr:MAG: hypothetical protein E6J94_10295 [Euryarchaeota archaeon]
MTSVTDPNQNTVSYAYSPTYSKAYVTQVSDTVGVRGRSTYDPVTGWPLSQLDGRGYLTRTTYDLLGRPTGDFHYDQPSTSEVLYLDMEWTTEEATPRMQDLSSFGNHGAITGTASMPGRWGLARDFPNQAGGTATHRVGPNTLSPSVPISAGVSFTFWVKADTLNVQQNLARFDDGTGSTFRVVPFMASTNELRVFDNAGTAGSSVTMTNGRWYHVAVVYTGSRKVIFVNGVERYNQTTTFGGGSFSRYEFGSDAGATALDGKIDEAYIFKRVLTQAEIGSLYATTFGLLSSSNRAYDDQDNGITVYEPTSRPRLLHFDMESLLNGKLEDLSGRGDQGTIVGTTSGPGKIGNARTFGGTSDWINAGNRVPVQITSGDFTVSAWIKTTSTSTDNEIVAKGGSCNVGGYKLITQSGYLRGTFNNQGGSPYYQVVSGHAINDGAWHLVSFVVTGLQSMSTIGKLYVDGVIDTTGPTIDTSTWDISTPDDLGIGSSDRIDPNSCPLFFSGTIDEVQMFSLALSASDISAIFSGSEKGFYQKAYFDSLTRVVRRDYFQSLVSWQTLSYNFRDQITGRTVARNSTASFTTSYGYDFLGRPTSVTYPGNAPPVSISYDDANRIRTVFAENGREAQYLYDVGGRMTAVREYYDATNYFTTSSAYDEVGNLLSVSNALGQVTQHQYDNLNRLT